MSSRPEPGEQTETEETEGNGQSQGVPAAGTLHDREQPFSEHVGDRHWRESKISQPGLDDRGDVFFAAIEMTRMPMILTDPNLSDNPVVFANKAFLDLTGYEEDEILGRNCRFLQGAQTDRNTVAELREAVAEVRSVSLEILNYRRDGSPFWNAVFIGPVYDMDGKLLYFFASQLDVTRRRGTEQAYRQAQKMESIGQLTAGLAHDFNNLLQVITGNLEMLATRVEDERADRYLDNARAAADRGTKLTRQLLSFARKSRLEPRPVDLTTLISEFSEVIDSTIGKSIDLQLHLKGRMPKALLDPDQLEMALLNVLINARDASSSGSTITIGTGLRHISGGNGEAELVPGDYVVLEVADEGEGMPPHVIERATEPFFTTKGVGKGTGLGLAMASGFVQQSRGRLEIESEVGAGTRVRMLFPVVRENEDAARSETQADAALPYLAEEAPRAEHILVVEDTPEVLQLAREILGSAGYGVTTARSGEEAFEIFVADHARVRFDLVFTDLLMPGGMNGMALAERITEADPTVSVLMTTGYSEELVAQGPRDRGADVLGKPYRRSELLDRVRQALNRRGSGGERRRPSDFGAVEA